MLVVIGLERLSVKVCRFDMKAKMAKFDFGEKLMSFF